jgi:hypothetical protein
MKTLNIILFIIILIVFVKCSKDNQFTNEIKTDSIMNDEKMAVQLIYDFEINPSNHEIIPESIKKFGEIMVSYDEIIKYDTTHFTFKLSNGASERINQLNLGATGPAFALIINKKVIFGGYFWAGYSSTSCDWIVMESYGANNRFAISLGYPPHFELNPDPRKDKRIIDVLSIDNKLE